MAGAKARHLQRVGDTAAGLFRQLLNFRIGVVMRHHHGIAPAQQALDFFAVKLLFVDGQRLRFSRERINRRFRIKHYAHHAISFYWLNSTTVSMACRRLNTVMVFYMLNKIADYELKVVMNFVHQTLFPGTVLRICPNDRFVSCAGTVSAA